MKQLQYIKTILFSELFNWSVQYLAETKISFNATYPLVRIGEFLKRNKTGIEIQDDVRYTRVKIRVRNGGVTTRDTEVGKNIGTKRQFVVSEGQFILSKIDARNGAMGIIPADLEGAIVTQDFLPYDIDTVKINPQYLLLVSTTAEFVAFCQTCSSGTTNRQRVEESKFLDIKIPLPSIREQESLVNNYYRRIKEAERLALQVHDLEKEIEKYLFDELGIEKIKRKGHYIGLKTIEYKDLDRWDGWKEDRFNSKYNIEKIGKYIVEISTGTTPPTNRPEYFDGDINFYTPAELGKEMYLINSERKISELALKEKKSRRFNKGTLLFVGIGSTVGKIGIVANNYAASNQQITGFRVDETILNNEFVFYYFHYFKEITTKEQTKSTLPIINQDKILNISIPIIPLQEQMKIVETITKKRNNICGKIKEIDLIKERAEQEFEKAIFS